jgi:iron complex outermembrane receptor protein
MCRLADALHRLTILLVLVAFVPAPRSAAAGAERGRQTYDIASGDAAKTLAKFVRQSGEQVVFVVPKVRGVTTNAVKGEYTGREALERMLDRTALHVVEDEKTGALLVNRTAANGGKPTLTESPPSAKKTENSQKMNSKRTNMIAAMAAWLGLTLMPSQAADAIGTGTIEGRVQNIAAARYLENARVSVQGSDIRVFTDEAGRYRITQVPAGATVLEVFYTGLDAQRIQVEVVAGQTIQRDIELTNAALYGRPDDTVQMSPLQVIANRDKDIATVAINEQRFAPNIKNVVATDAHGEVISGDMTEFLKYLPGIDIGASGGAQIRGFPENLTEVTTDGASLANAGDANSPSNRTFRLNQLSTNNISRIEVTKMPTPATPADSMAGSINMISKSAFESDRWQFRYTVSMTSDQAFLDFKKQPSAGEEMVYYVKPSANFDLILPLGKKFGLTLAGLHHSVATPLNRVTRNYAGTVTGTSVSNSAPVLQSIQLPITTQFQDRDSVSLKLDWRVTAHSALSVSYQHTAFDASSMNISFSANVGSNGTPSVAGGTPLSYGPDYTIGATGRGNFGQTSGYNLLHNQLGSGVLNYRYNDGEWKVDAMATASRSGSKTNNEADGFFRGFSHTTKVPIRVSFFDINDLGPGRIEAFTNDNQPFDIYDINNYNVNTVASQITDMVSKHRAGSVDVKRWLRILPFASSVQAGWRGKKNTYDRLLDDRPGYTYQGINGNLSAAPYASTIFRGVEQPLVTGIERSSSQPLPYISPHYGFRAFQENPARFAPTAAQIVARERTAREREEYFEESVNALYLQAEMRLLRNRLNVLTGVRYERTDILGVGVLTSPEGVWVRDPDGNFARTATGARIRKPEAGVVGSMQELDFIRIRRGATAERSYDGFYPSVHLTYSITDNFLARASYAKTYGRPNYSEVIPNTSISERDLGEDPPPGSVLGTINVRNTGLRPWTAENYEFALEYYTNMGGLFGAGVFRKDVSDFFGTLAKVATAADLNALGLDPGYVDWQLNTKINTGDAEISGFELNATHSLRPLGEWAKDFRAFANLTRLEVKGDQEADFRDFQPKSASWGVSYNNSRLSVITKWSYRGDLKRTAFAGLGPDAYLYREGGINLDVNTAYQLNKRLGVFFQVLNATREEEVNLRYGSETPDYARAFQSAWGGTKFYAGVRGTF